MKAAGGCSPSAMKRARDRVASTRLSRSRALRAAVHRPAAIDSPARLTMTSAPVQARAQGPLAVPSGVQACIRAVGRPGRWSVPGAPGEDLDAMAGGGRGMRGPGRGSPIRRR